jgi:hypothetical protein
MYLKMRRRAAVTAVGAFVLVGMLVTAQVASAVFVRPKAATPFQVPLVVAHNACVTGGVGSPAGMAHNPANIAAASCAPEVKSSTIITHGDPTINGQVANFQGNTKQIVSGCPGAGCDVLFPSATVGANGLVVPGPNAGANYMQDVRCGPGNGACNFGSNVGWTGAGSGDDYIGAVVTNSSLRITDNNNSDTGAPYTTTATTEQISFSVPSLCQTTAATGVGSFCTPAAFDPPGPATSVTGANSLCGCVAGGTRANIEQSQLQVFDGGPNGNPSDTTDGPNTTIARQGIFLP